jgi:hypothetical protein
MVSPRTQLSLNGLSDNISLAIKYKKITEDKQYFDTMINDIYNSIKYNISKLDDNISNHNEFINFIKIINLYEDYKWRTLKYNYSKIKKKINKDKKTYKSLIELYGDIISYYTPDQIEMNNRLMKEVSEYYDMMLYSFIQLHNIHKDIYIKCKYFIKSDKIIKVNNITSDNMLTLIELYKLYIDIKYTNKKLGIIQSRKQIINYIE